MEPDRGSVQTFDGRTLNTYTWGGGDVVVVFEAGLGAGGRCWSPVAEQVSGHVKAVAYDRAGYGTSTADAGCRTLDALAVDLVRVVEAQGAPDVVLVGHSWGGPIARRAAELLPAGVVSSLVLVDPSDEHADVYFTRSARAMDWVQALVLPAVARAGLLRAGLSNAFGRFLAPKALKATLDACSTPAAARVCVEENRHIRDALQQLREAPQPRPVSTVVISGTKPTRIGGSRRELCSAHRRSVAANSGWRLVEASESTHYVLFTQPQLVADQVLRACSTR
ncbi:alpha/beta fold hydrolase [uncultured Micrococcus sp.]|uniref:alpha/beta fold hydrolase n=1 Tax=uncultured Micrococcus sp. TaxID=114051 RepID=UPI00345BBD12